MFKKIISIIGAVCMSFTSIWCNPIYAREDITAGLNESEYGYIFTVRQKPNIELMSCEYDIDIDTISDIANIYHVDTLEELKNVSNYLNIDMVAEDIKVELFEYPDDTNDTLYSTQWMMNACNIPYFWKNGVTGEGVVVGVIDTGINPNHEDFEGLKIKDGVNICAMLEDSDEYDINDTTDTNGHGTGVTGVIAAATNNNRGVAGVTDKVTIVPIKIYDEDSSYSLSVGALLKGIEYAYLHGCDVINLSLGFAEPSDYLKGITNELIQSVVLNNVLIIAAAGNKGASNNRLEYPVACDNVIGVASVMYNGDTYMRSSFSTANSSVYVSAPGSSITGLKYDNDTGYEFKNGTSFSAPIVTGLAAGLKQIYPDMTVNEFMSVLRETCIDLDTDGYDENTGYGLVDFEKAYEKTIELLNAKESPEPTITPEPEPEKDIYTYLEYDSQGNRIKCTIENITDNYLPVIGIISVYNKGSLQTIKTINGIYSGKQTIYINSIDGSADDIKFLVWEDFNALKPYENAQICDTRLSRDN